MKAQEIFSRPNDVAELKGMIASRAFTLPEQQERVARRALASPSVIAFGTASSIATECCVSPATVVRLATALGFENFREFRTFFRRHLKWMAIKEPCIDLPGKP
jgi:DNA-binding MurR/RpiR family transcriptional regulator